jgi:hypothetical protein
VTCKHKHLEQDGICGVCGLTEEWRTIDALKAEVSDLKARLKVLARIGESSYFRVDPTKRDAFFRAADLRRKKWRES